MRYSGVCFRAHDPRWSFKPLSGEGARQNGGRFNPKGIDALYLSTSLETCILEATQGLTARLKPLTIVSYDVDVADVADLTDETERNRLEAQMEKLDCAWLALRASGLVPPSWKVVERLRKDFAGILVHSFAPGAKATHVNLVLWRWNDGPNENVRIFDPDERLPRDQSSWPG